MVEEQHKDPINVSELVKNPGHWPLPKSSQKLGKNISYSWIGWLLKWFTAGVPSHTRHKCFHYYMNLRVIRG